MRWVRLAVLIIIATVLQASFIDRLAISDTKPDLLLILLVFCAIFCKKTDAIITSFALGFAADLISKTMGINMIGFGLLGTTFAYASRFINLRKMPYQALAIFILGFWVSIITYLLALLVSDPAEQNIYAVLFGTPLYSAIVGPFLFLPSAWWLRIKTNRHKKR